MVTNGSGNENSSFSSH